MLSLPILLIIVVLSYFVARYTIVDPADSMKRQTVANAASQRANSAEHWVIFAAIAIWAVVSLIAEGMSIDSIKFFLVVVWVVGALNKLVGLLFGFTRRKFYGYTFAGLAWRAAGVTALVAIDQNYVIYAAAAFEIAYLIWTIMVVRRSGELVLPETDAVSAGK